jgi:hypothetical protein
MARRAQTAADIQTQARIRRHIELAMAVHGGVLGTVEVHRRGDGGVADLARPHEASMNTSASTNEKMPTP